MAILKFLFVMEKRVTGWDYRFWGLTLMVFKYAGELALYYLARGAVLSPLSFLSPLLYERYPGMPNMPDWFMPVIVIWSLPFIWIGTGMSIRRAADAGVSPWLGLLFFVPGLNYVMMLALSMAPTSRKANWERRKVPMRTPTVFYPIAGAFVFALAGTLLVWTWTSALGNYSSSLFVGSPLVLGLIQGYILNAKCDLKVLKTMGFVLLTILLIHLFLLIFALEGLICLAMSLPISSALALMGAIFGMGMARYGKPRSLAPTILVLALPVLPWVEGHSTQPYQDMVLSVREINASPAEVWPNVVKFSDLPPTEDWLFRLGVAYPVRARIEGTGIGAIRRCEFSTGAFVEPITVWEEPRLLGFNVQYRPQPMRELSFYDHVDAPHLNGYFRSVRGEFRLISTGDGKTRLEGRTWYEMDMHPGWYWQLYGRWFIHKIHQRVLGHIQNLSEHRFN